MVDLTAYRKKIVEICKREFKKVIPRNDTLLLYGPLCRGDFVPRFSEINLVWIFAKPLKYKTIKKVNKAIENIKSHICEQITIRLCSLKEFEEENLIGVCDPISLLSYSSSSILISGKDTTKLIKKCLEKFSITKVYSTIIKKLERDLYLIKKILTTVNKKQNFEFNLPVRNLNLDPYLYKLYKVGDLFLESVTYFLVLFGKLVISKNDIPSNLNVVKNKRLQKVLSEGCRKALKLRVSSFKMPVKGKNKLLEHWYILARKLLDVARKKYVYNQINNAFKGILKNDTPLPYRKNVGVILKCKKGYVIIKKDNEWKFVQGGVEEGEREKEAMYRELYEELGIKKDDIKKVKELQIRNVYDWPDDLQKKKKLRGQVQKYFEVEIGTLNITLGKEISTYRLCQKEEVSKLVKREDLKEVWHSYLKNKVK